MRTTLHLMLIAPKERILATISGPHITSSMPQMWSSMQIKYTLEVHISYEVHSQNEEHGLPLLNAECEWKMLLTDDISGLLDQLCFYDRAMNFDLLFYENFGLKIFTPKRCSSKFHKFSLKEKKGRRIFLSFLLKSQSFDDSDKLSFGFFGLFWKLNVFPCQMTKKTSLLCFCDLSQNCFLAGTGAKSGNFQTTVTVKWKVFRFHLDSTCLY